MASRLMTGLYVNLISKDHLLKNKKASARHKDLDDFEHLSEDWSENKPDADDGR